MNAVANTLAPAAAVAPSLDLSQLGIDPPIHASGIDKRYGGQTVLAGAGLQLEPGAVLVLGIATILGWSEKRRIAKLQASGEFVGTTEVNVADIAESLPRSVENASGSEAMRAFVFSWFLLGPPSMR